MTFHQTHSAPVMEDLRQWMEAQFAEHKTEPISGAGQGNLLLAETLDETDTVPSAAGSVEGDASFFSRLLTPCDFSV